MPQVYFFYQRIKVGCREGQTIQEVAYENNIPVFFGRGKVFNCRGMGLCKACLVRVIPTDHVSPKSVLERIKLLPNHWRLSCRTKILQDVTVWIQGDYPIKLKIGEWEKDSQKVELSETEHLIEEVTPEKVKQLIDEGVPITLLDVREPLEHERAHIGGAVLLPLSQLQDRLSDIDQESDIIVFCHHGMRSRTAAGILLTAGFKRVRHMGGGIDGWSLKVDFSVPRY